MPRSYISAVSQVPSTSRPSISATDPSNSRTVADGCCSGSAEPRRHAGPTMLRTPWCAGTGSARVASEHQVPADGQPRAAGRGLHLRGVLEESPNLRRRPTQAAAPRLRQRRAPLRRPLGRAHLDRGDRCAAALRPRSAACGPTSGGPMTGTAGCSGGSAPCRSPGTRRSQRPDRMSTQPVASPASQPSHRTPLCGFRQSSGTGSALLVAVGRAHSCRRVDGDRPGVEVVGPPVLTPSESIAHRVRPRHDPSLVTASAADGSRSSGRAPPDG
jgi:hypothetical protein